MANSASPYATNVTESYRNPISFSGYNFADSTRFSGFKPENLDKAFEFSGNVQLPDDLYLGGARALGEPQQASPTQPGGEAAAPQPGWGEQWGKLLSGIGRFGAGLGAGIAAARGDMPMAGQMLSSYFEDKTGDTSGDSLAKALKTLKDAGLISTFTLDTGDDTTKVV